MYRVVFLFYFVLYSKCVSIYAAALIDETKARKCVEYSNIYRIYIQADSF